jgi:hypothetical protein
MEPGAVPMLELIDSTTGLRLAIDYAGISAFQLSPSGTSPADTLMIVLHHSIVTLEGKDLRAMCEPLQDHKISTIRTFCAKTFAPPAAGQPLIERFAERLRTPETTRRRTMRRYAEVWHGPDSIEDLGAYV